MHLLDFFVTKCDVILFRVCLRDRHFLEYNVYVLEEHGGETLCLKNIQDLLRIRLKLRHPVYWNTGLAMWKQGIIITVRDPGGLKFASRRASLISPMYQSVLLSQGRSGLDGV